eukprot:CAMPEP_0171604240 /NCGR_PEP_ID=MMETSP0990-20121206/6497_1 /TAXON_ID=483369 /ORGANISM="non described non described, Strain CCMP2098" /LENGTH=146 /DNA_ID=CAMNT_0012166743 /DNA_START=6 /DNA_END=446 /DNA_ORIENTATION=-
MRPSTGCWQRRDVGVLRRPSSYLGCLSYQEESKLKGVLMEPWLQVHGGVAELRPCVHLFLAVSGSPTSLQVGDMATSRKWLERAAKQGHSKAQVILRLLWLWPFLRRFQLALGHLGMSLAELPINRVVESAAAVFLLLLISRLAFL